MEIPADGILCEASEVTTDQSAMTGETQPVHKALLEVCKRKKQELNQNRNDQNDKHEVPSPILLSGTKILSGEGKMVVLVVGQESCIGKIKELLDQDDEILTPLQEKLEKLASDIGKFGMYSAILIFVVLMIRFSIEKISKPWETNKDLK